MNLILRFYSVFGTFILRKGTIFPTSEKDDLTLRKIFPSISPTFQPYDKTISHPLPFVIRVPFRLKVEKERGFRRVFRSSERLWRMTKIIRRTSDGTQKREIRVKSQGKIKNMEINETEQNKATDAVGYIRTDLHYYRLKKQN